MARKFSNGQWVQEDNKEVTNQNDTDPKKDTYNQDWSQRKNLVTDGYDESENPFKVGNRYTLRDGADEMYTGVYSQTPEGYHRFSDDRDSGLYRDYATLGRINSETVSVHDYDPSYDMQIAGAWRYPQVVNSGSESSTTSAKQDSGSVVVNEIPKLNTQPQTPPETGEDDVPKGVAYPTDNSDAAKYSQQKMYLGNNAPSFNKKGDAVDFSDFSWDADDDPKYANTSAGGNASAGIKVDSNGNVVSDLAAKTPDPSQLGGGLRDIDDYDRKKIFPTEAPNTGEEDLPFGNASAGIKVDSNGNVVSDLAAKTPSLMPENNTTWDDLWMQMTKGGNDEGNDKGSSDETEDETTITDSDGSKTDEDPKSDRWEDQEDQSWQNYMRWVEAKENQHAKQENKNSWWRLLNKGLLGAANIAGAANGAPAMNLNWNDKERDAIAYQRLKDDKSQAMSLVQKQIEQMNKDREYERKAAADLRKIKVDERAAEEKYKKLELEAQKIADAKERDNKLYELKKQHQEEMLRLRREKQAIEADLAEYKKRVLISTASKNYSSANKSGSK